MFIHLIYNILIHHIRNVKSLLSKSHANPFLIIENRGIAVIHYTAGMENVRFAEQVMAELLLNNVVVDDGTESTIIADGERNINVLTDDDETPLHVAAFWGRSNICKMLIGHGADIHLRDGDNLTPIDCFIAEGHMELANIFKVSIFERELAQKAKSSSLSLLMPPAIVSKNSFLTPNRINYNFDKSSPYYINITHRRKQINIPRTDDMPTKKTKESHTPLHSSDDDDDDDVADQDQRTNLFKLTQDNLKQLQSFNGSVGDISLVEKWRSKVNRRQRSTSILPSNLDDLDETIAGIVEQKTAVCQLDDAAFFSDDDFSFVTANDDFYQMAEVYVHTDNEKGIQLFEQKILPAVPMPRR